MTLSEALATIAFAGREGVTIPCRSEGFTVAAMHLIALGLVFVQCNGNLAASVEHGYYPAYASDGSVRRLHR